MTWKETNSLSLQLRYVYSVNRKSTHPNHIDVCGIKKGGQTREHMEKVEGFPDRWVGRAFHCFEGNLEEVYGSKCVVNEGDVVGDANDGDECDEMVKQGKESLNKDSEEIPSNASSNDSNSATNNNSEDQPYPKLPPNHQFVYLTGDSPNTLTTLDNNTTYIIGGIVDRNRLKQAAIQRAESINAGHNPSLNIKTARLPLDEHLDFKGSTRILTCNHVFQILQNYRENGYKDWKGSIMGVLPCRKEVEDKNDRDGELVADNEKGSEDIVDLENEDVAIASADDDLQK